MCLAVAAGGCCNSSKADIVSDEQLMDEVQRQTFNYFWDGAEPTSGMARERYHVDGEYFESDPPNVVTSGGSGFGIMAIIAGIERGYITPQQGLEHFEQMVGFLESADKFHGAFPHWWDGETGKVKPFGTEDNGGDLVETAFLVQGLLALHQFYKDGTPEEQALAQRIDKIWKDVEWDWYRNGEDVLYWHWSPDQGWVMNFPVRGYNECLIMYVLAAASPTHGVPAEVYHRGWAEDGAIVSPHKAEGVDLGLRYQLGDSGPLFWAHYSFLGLDPNGLKDKYSADYAAEMRNYTLANRAYALRNPKGYKGYGEDSWGLTASYSTNGYAAHAPNVQDDHGVITPTAALSSIVYTPEESMQAMRYFRSIPELWGEYGFYDAFSETDKWYPQRYLAIDQGPIAVMLENQRSGLLWELFMSHPDVQNGLKTLEFESPRIQ